MQWLFAEYRFNIHLKTKPDTKIDTRTGLP